MTDVIITDLPTTLGVTQESPLPDALAVDNGTISDADTIVMLKENLDVFFLLMISFIVFFLQAGFAFLEVGAVRSKNATNILIKNLLDVFLGGVAFWLVGYPLAFGHGNSWFGHTYWASTGMPDLQLAHWCFQFVFAATAATIVSGSVAERCAFSAYVVYSVVLTGFVYPIIAHWSWSENGWLSNSLYHDFAGSGVVHLTGGVSALMGALMLGPRIGRFSGRIEEMKGHSVPLAGLGGFILLFGFLAFNGGSQGSISQPGDAEAVARAVMNTIISGAFGGLTVLLIFRISGNKIWSFLMTLNGALAGMVSICSGCDVHRPWGAMVTGSVGGCLFVFVHYLMIKIRVDDPLDAVAVHMGGGIWGLIATSLFMDRGIVYGDVMGIRVLSWNLAGMFSIIAWSGSISLIMFGTLKAFKILRVSENMEIKGMDILKHGEPAYPVNSWIEEQYSSSKTENKIGVRQSGLPNHMNPPRGPFDPEMINYNQATFYPQQNPHYWTMPNHRRHPGQRLQPVPIAHHNYALDTKNNKSNKKQLKGYCNEAMEMETTH